MLMLLVLPWGSLSTAQAAQAEVEQAAAEEEPVVQLAILLDTSGSMRGLIDQARSQLWKVVNELALAKQNGRSPRIEVSLYEYGSGKLSSDDGWIRQILPLTTDLDAVSEALFALKAGGDKEYCGQVISQAVSNLKWSKDPGAYQAIFIAGNEPFTQGPVDYQKACSAAASQGIMVNTIHCGAESAAISGKWKHAATLADGKFMCIDKDKQVAHVKAPQDQQIAKLSAQLNTTYVPYGPRGEMAARRQDKQDSNAAQAAQGAVVSRALAKASGNYRNAHWDLVDCYLENQGKLPAIKPENLPPEIRKLSQGELNAHLDKLAQQRQQLHRQIQELNAERQKYLKQQMAKQPKAAGLETLDQVIIPAVRTQAIQRNYEFSQPGDGK